MFKFNTTTIINSNEDFTTGLALLDNTSTPDALMIKRGLTIKKKYVRAIYKRAYNDPELAKVNIDLSALDSSDPGVYRIAVYVRLEGSENEYFANDYVFKGKPFYIEFVKKTGDDAAALAEKIVKIAKKYMQMVYEYPLISITAEEDDGSATGVVVLEATDEYQRFTKVELQYFDDEAGLPTGCCGVGAGDWVVLEKLNVNPEEGEDTSSDKIQWATGEDEQPLKGKEGFGTYRNLVKNLRLPTADNLRWGHILQDEVPVPGATYNQYTIWYCRKVGIQGLAHVGDIVQSLTSHIFFVNTCDSTLISNFETYLAALGNVVDVKDTSGVSVPVSTIEDEWELNAQANAAAGNEGGQQGGNEGGNAQGGNEGGNSQGGGGTNP